MLLAKVKKNYYYLKKLSYSSLTEENQSLQIMEPPFGNCPLFEVIIVPKNGKLHVTVYQKEINTLG